MSVSFRYFVIVTILCCSNMECTPRQSIIWNKNRQEFVNLHNISVFGNFQSQFTPVDNDVEICNMNKQIMKVAYYEDRNLIMFYDNDTKITGINGEIWYLIADILNFTLVPIKYHEPYFGVHLDNGTYTGLLGLLHGNKTDVILRTGLYLFRASSVDYTTPIWKTSYRLYIRPKFYHDHRWMITIFARETWYSICFLFCILVVVGYLLQQITSEQVKVIKSADYYTLGDHVFYTHSIMCGQGYLPDGLQNNFKIFSISKSIFAWLVTIAFSSHLIYRMTNKVTSPPFSSMSDLVNNTDYTILAYEGSMIYEELKKNVERLHILSGKKKRKFPVEFVPISSQLYRKACDPKKRYAMLEMEDRFNIVNELHCELVPVGSSNYPTWIGFAVIKQFKYKKPINKSIIKLYEVGLLNALKTRWMGIKDDTNADQMFEVIDMYQVQLNFILLVYGTIISIFLCLGENIAFRYKKRRK